MCFPFGSEDTTKLSCTGTETGKLWAGTGTGESGGLVALFPRQGQWYEIYHSVWLEKAIRNVNSVMPKKAHTTNIL